VEYTLGPIADWSSIPQAARLRQRGNYVLVLRSEREKRPLGVLALRPKLAPGIEDLVQTCQRYGVQLAVLSSGDQIAAQALAYRANVTLLENDDAVEAIRAKQKEGGHSSHLSRTTQVLLRGLLRVTWLSVSRMIVPICLPVLIC